MISSSTSSSTSLNSGLVTDEIKPWGARLTLRPPGVDKVFEPGPGRVFVFGSNLAGIHGAGAAAYAYRFFGAIWDEGIGLMGSSYAIPTKSRQLQSLPLEEINKYVENFVVFAWEHTELYFFVTRIGCGLAGFTDADIAPMFKEAPPNCELPHGWDKYES